MLLITKEQLGSRLILEAWGNFLITFPKCTTVVYWPAVLKYQAVPEQEVVEEGEVPQGSNATLPAPL